MAKLGNRNTIRTSSFVQYEHLEYLSILITYDTRLGASMGNDYMVAPDVVIYRKLVSDEKSMRIRLLLMILFTKWQISGK